LFPRRTRLGSGQVFIVQLLSAIDAATRLEDANFRTPVFHSLGKVLDKS